MAAVLQDEDAEMGVSSSGGHLHLEQPRVLGPFTAAVMDMRR